ncbi:aldo/keto reductase [Leptolyngbya sp. FACHB-261]|uniref:aldo/keto reductase n=1 Tax=Leptolyngbya sp. FACHB-261 TaxID=2692806 RepID=UPI001689484C|nr:aldo/keto reductase [Leptolyngbya sp. FACHB-261]MBD2103652.1 aldo/keto reductase [Leptolyngbya sp. FACHB-261]
MASKRDESSKQNSAWELNRRQLLRSIGFIGAGAGAVLAEHILQSNDQAEAAEASGPATETPAETPLAQAPTRPASGEIPRRPLGKTGVQVSALGLGGATLGQAKSKEEAIRITHEAIDNGITFMDNAWEYNNHRSEEWMGDALQGRRDQAFLMTKVCTHGRDRRVAMQQLEESLRRLKTDYVDLWQIHEVVYYNDPEMIFRPNGAIEALEQAKKEGKVRFVGFTGHKDPALHLKMLAYDYPFDTVQLPLNCFDASFMSFEKQVLPELSKRQIAAIGMKSLSGNGAAVKQGVVTAQEALRYALSLPVATVVSGIDSLEVLRQNLAIARGLQPMTQTEKQALRDRCARYASDGRFELFKTSKQFDADEGRLQHGFPPQSQTQT